MTTMDKNKILEVRDLRISFRTPGGLVKAVRGINYELYKGETLAIVGESGSGKSVTSRALLGISAGNAVIENGEIIFDGKDLLKINEEDFHKIRGEKISMIFQDPLSSLNPIVKIGKQLTEAMVIKGKAKQRKSRKYFNEKLALIKKYMDLSQNAEKGGSSEQANAERVKKFDTFEYKHTKLEGAYNDAKEALAEAIDEIDDLVLRIEREAVKNAGQSCHEIKVLAHRTINPYVVSDETPVKALTEKLMNDVSGGKTFWKSVLEFVKPAKAVVSKEICESLLPTLKELRAIFAEADEKPMPSFFAMAYYLTFSEQPLPEMAVPELNDFLKNHLRNDFMNDFIAHTEKAILFAFNESLERKKKVVTEIEEFNTFIRESTDEKAILNRAKVFADKVEESINKLALIKDSIAYTFRGSFTAAVKEYYRADRANKKEIEKCNKEKQKYETKKAAGKTPDSEPQEPSLIDTAAMVEGMLSFVAHIEEKFKADIAAADRFDATAETRNTVDFLRTTAAAVVNKVTKRMAKRKALKIMDEVGIPDPRRRFNQYPFEFSGGMRQRIVIAIALTANPEILVCDEPTTALDVTIQAQILELINNLKKKHNLSVIFITHDLGVVANMADRIAVMYAGKIVESGTAEEVFYTPAHPYTWALLSSMPDLETTEKLEAIPGTPPNMLFPPKGDAFAARNKYAMKIDFEEQPPMFKISDTHQAATWLLHPDAPKVEVPKLVFERIERNKKMLRGKIAADEAAEGGKTE